MVNLWQCETCGQVNQPHQVRCIYCGSRNRELKMALLLLSALVLFGCATTPTAETEICAVQHMPSVELVFVAYGPAPCPDPSGGPVNLQTRRFSVPRGCTYVAFIEPMIQAPVVRLKCPSRNAPRIGTEGDPWPDVLRYSSSETPISAAGSPSVPRRWS